MYIILILVYVLCFSVNLKYINIIHEYYLKGLFSLTNTFLKYLTYICLK